MSRSFYTKCLDTNFKELFERKGYAFFTKGEYNLNIIGVRSYQYNKVTNTFDDYLIVDYNTKTEHHRKIYSITTEPGLFYMRKPINKDGAAILVPGQYKGCYQISKHRGLYKALCQCKSVAVYRDNNKNDIYDLEPKSIQNGLFGINIHRAHNSVISYSVDKYSAGCQVFKHPEEFKEFMVICNKAKAIWGNHFTYTLITEEDIDEQLKIQDK